MAKLWAYIDCFNLYYRVLRSRPHIKWLNLFAMVQTLYPLDQVDRVKAFVARIRPSPFDRDQHIRQEKYLDALSTIPAIDIIEGKYVERETRLPELNAWRAGVLKPVGVIKQEEKGSDVNLGAHLVFDGCHGRYEKAVVVSSDSDLAEPIRLVNHELRIPVYVSSPLRTPPMELMQASTFCQKIRPAKLKQCLLPDPITMPDGRQVFKPTTWV